jgi:hypothetical protein
VSRRLLGLLLALGLPLRALAADAEDAPRPEEAPPAADAAPGLPPPSSSEGFQRPLPPLAELLAGPAARLAALSPGDCRTALRASSGAATFAFADPADGIATPLRVAGPLGAVALRVPPKSVPFGLLDCRLALLLLELTPTLERHGVRALRVDNFYRPGARLGGRHGKKKSQHSYGLAIDLPELTMDVPDDGEDEPVRVLVKDDFRGARGEPPCGPDARLHLPEDATVAERARARALRELTCELARGGWFHHVITPNNDAAHEDHLHLDLQRGGRWFSAT